MHMSRVKGFVKRIPVIGDISRNIYNALTARKPEQKVFPGTGIYWEKRYLADGHSGVGSYGKFAEFKSEIINKFVYDHNIKTIIEFGCGDGNQLLYSEYPNYLGVDISPTAINKCKKMFADDPCKSFITLDEYNGQVMELALSIDVIYHLIEDDTFYAYMRQLFDSASRFVIIYSSNTNDNTGFEVTHVKHRKFTTWIKANRSDWSLKCHIPNRYPYEGDYKKGSFAEFYIYEKTA